MAFALLTYAGGIPDAPNVMRNDNILNWTVPMDNGEAITVYLVSLRYVRERS